MRRIAIVGDVHGHEVRLAVASWIERRRPARIPAQVDESGQTLSRAFYV